MAGCLLWVRNTTCGPCLPTVTAHCRAVVMKLQYGAVAGGNMIDAAKLPPVDAVVALIDRSFIVSFLLVIAARAL